MKYFTLLVVCLFTTNLYSQIDIANELLAGEKTEKEYVAYTFKSTRIINMQSVEMTKKYALDFLISHRFGDVAGPDDHIHTLIGFDKAEDIALSFDFGITEDLSIGIARMKGSGPFKELWNSSIKYRVLKQTTDFKIPLTIVLYGNAAISSMKRNKADANALNYFPAGYKGFAQRMSYNVQALIACKATNWLSIQLTPSFVWRNMVDYNDKNGMFFLGLGARAKFNKRSGMVFEYILPIIKEGVGGREYLPMLRGRKNAPYYPSLHIGYEFETGGHVFHINLTNSSGLLEQDYLPYTNRNWAQGQFRLGFTITRGFQLDQKGGKYWKKGSVEDSKN
jgi:hypothetical protein